MESSYLENMDVAELAEAAKPRPRIVLVIRASDGVLHDVIGGPIVIGLDPVVSPKDSWYWKEECVYVKHNDTWKKVCGPNYMVLAIQANDGTLVDVLGGPISEGSNPNVDPTGSWRWKTSSPGCVYVKHNGVWKKVCS